MRIARAAGSCNTSCCDRRSPPGQIFERVFQIRLFLCGMLLQPRLSASCYELNILHSCSQRGSPCLERAKLELCATFMNF